MEKYNEIWSYIKTIWIEWGKDCTCHGLSNLIKSKNKALRLIWLACYLSSSCVCIFLISLSFISYLGNPVSTTISVVDDEPAIFPTVSICNLDPLVTDDAAINSQIADIIRSTNFNISSMDILMYQLSASREISYFLSILNASEKLAYGNTVENSVYSCMFNSKPCPSNWYEYYFNFMLGNCYKFNSKGTYKVGKSGRLPSLQLIYVIGDSLSNVSNYFEMGIRILVHNSSVFLPLVYENGLPLAPGFNYDIKVSRVFFNRLGHPYSDCLKDLTNATKDQTDIMKIMFNQMNVTTYSQQYCQNYAFQLYLANNCSCVNPNSPYADVHFPKCINSSQVQCQSMAFQVVYSDPLYYFESQCPKECDYFVYIVEVSQSQFPTRWFYENALKSPPPYPVSDRIAKIKTYQDARENFLAFNIYYSQLSYVLILEKPYWDVFLLMSSIGGNLALFVGMSLLSFVEIFELIFISLEYLIVKGMTRNRAAPTDQPQNSFK